MGRANGKPRTATGEALKRQGVQPGTAEWMRGIRPPAPALSTGGSVRIPEATILAANGEIVRAAPHLAAFPHVVQQLARVLCRLEVMDRVQGSHPRGWIIQATGSGRIKINSGEKHYLALVELARRLLTDCGLTPQSAKLLGLHLGEGEKDVVAEARALARDQEAEFKAYREAGNGDGTQDTEGDAPAG